MIRCTAAPKLCLGALLLSGSLCAQEHTRVVVDYAAPAECPPAAAFQRDLATRLPKDRIVSLGPIPQPVSGSLGLQVRVSKTAGGYRAELTTVTREGRSSPRNLEAPVCSELMDAMGFTAALTVDPNATTLATAPTNDEPAPTEPGTKQGETTPPAGAAAETRPARDATSATDSEPMHDLPSPEPTSHHDPNWATSVVAGIALTGPISPGVSPGLIGGLRYSDESPGRWSPAVTFAVFGSQLVSSYSPTASFAAVGAHLEFCPSSLRDRSITIRLCAAGQLTMLRAEGENLTNEAEVTVALPSLGAHIELRQALSSQWFLSAIGGAQVPLQHHRFDVGRPAAEVATTRAIAPFVSLQLGAFL